MKKLHLIVILAGINICAFSQNQNAKDEMAIVQSTFGTEKRALIEEFMKLEGAKKDAFFAVYDEYEAKRKELGKKRVDLLTRYVDNLNSLDDSNSDPMIQEMMGLQSQNDKLISTYYDKIKKTSGAKVAAQFYQLENYVLSKIRTEIMESVPLIGELDKSK